MSEMINKVLASTAQSFSTAEQKQARDNIDAMAASASSLFYSTSNPSAFISGVDHDSNLSGNGRTTPLGLNTSITIANNGASATLAYDQLKLAYSDNDPIISASNGTIYMSGHAGNASSPYTANYDLQGMRIYGTDTYNHITATASVYYSGAEFHQGTDSANIKATGMTLHTNDDGDQLVDASSVVRWNSYSSMSSFTGCSANNCISGDGTSGSPLGLSSKIRLETSYSALELQPNYILVNNHVGSAQIGNSYLRLSYPLNGGSTAHLNNSALTFIDSSNHTEQVDGSSINRWNSYSAATQVVSRSYPYSDAVNYTSLTIYNPSQTYGASIQDPSATTIGYLVPKYLAPADLGKVLTVVSDDGYKCEWKDPTGGIPQITPMGAQTYYASGNDYINLEDNVAYFIETNAGGSFTIHLGTLSRQTIHSKLYLVGTQSNCVTMTVVYEDEAGQVCQLDFVYGDSQSDTYYGLDVYARLVTIGGGRSISYDTTMCRVYDYPCQNRDYFSSDNNNIGLVVNYEEPM